MIIVRSDGGVMRFCLETVDYNTRKVLPKVSTAD